MTLEQYQLELSASGGVETEPMRRFREGNAEAAAWRRQALAFERQLAAALAVPVPGDLVDSLLDLAVAAPAGAADADAPARTAPGPVRATVPVRARRRWRLPLALAAGLAGVLALGLLLRPLGLGDLPARAVEHVGAHDAALAADGPVPLASLRQAFTGFGRQPEAVPASLSFVSVCPLGDTGTVHLVLHDGAGTPVTAFFLREAPARRTARFEHGGMAGHYQRLDHGGAVLLVGGARSDHAALAARIDRALTPAGGAAVATR
jgi:hypothetical protein